MFAKTKPAIYLGKMDVAYGQENHSHEIKATFHIHSHEVSSNDKLETF